MYAPVKIQKNPVISPVRSIARNGKQVMQFLVISNVSSKTGGADVA